MSTPPLLYPHRGGALVAVDDRGFEEGRQYLWDGIWLDSVTSIISQGVPKGEALIKWATRECGNYAAQHRDELAELPPEEHAERVKTSPFNQRDDAAELGTNVHDYAEAYVLGTPVPELSEAGEKKAALFRRWLDEFKPEFIAAEAWVYSMGRRYAGRFDAIARVNDVLTLIDYKTGKRAYAEVGLQLAALRNAEFIGLPDGSEVEMPRVDACAVLHIGATKYAFNRVRAEDDEFNTFLYAAEIAKWRKNANSVVIGPAIFPPPLIAPRPNAPVNVAAMLD